MAKLSPISREVLDILAFVRESSLRGRLKRADLDKRLALVHTDNAVELMLKDYLITIKNIPSNHAEELSKASYHQLLKKCKELKTVKLYENELRKLHDARNRLYHETEYWLSPKDEWLRSCIEIAEDIFQEIYGKSVDELSKEELRATLTLYEDYIRMLETRFREKGPAPGAPWTTIIRGSDALKVYDHEVHFYAHWMPTRPKFLGGLRTEVMLKCNTSFKPLPLEEVKDLVGFCEVVSKERGRGLALGKPIHRFWLGFASFNGFDENAANYVRGFSTEGVGIALVNISHEPHFVARSRNKDGERAAYWFRI